MSKKLPIIALVGPPNVGKSTLFNKILGHRVAITDDKPGTTRDRTYGETSWRGKKMLLVDTGGLISRSGEPLDKDIKKQTEIAITEADLILFTVDGQAPATAAGEALKILRQTLRQHKEKLPPVVLAVNKIDKPKEIEEKNSVFTRLGIDQICTTSAISGRGVGDLLDVISQHLKENEAPENKPPYAKVALVGKPNVGKSTLLNTIAGEERAITSPIAGTTRSAVDTHITWQDKNIRFIDTAGMRRRARIDIDAEQYALFQAIKGIESAEIVILVIDVSEELARFEKSIAGRLKEGAKGIILALNKIDLLEDKADLKQILSEITIEFPFLKFARVVPISAIKGLNIDELMSTIVSVKEARNQEIPPEDLRRAFRYWVKKHPPKYIRGQKKAKLFDFLQSGINPPTFELVVNERRSVHFSYVRYIENQIRKYFGFEGTAIRIKVRKPEK